MSAEQIAREWTRKVSRLEGRGAGNDRGDRCPYPPGFASILGLPWVFQGHLRGCSRGFGGFGASTKGYGRPIAVLWATGPVVDTDGGCDKYIYW